MDTFSKNTVIAQEEDARSVIDSIIVLHAATQRDEIQPKLLFRILQVMFAIQIGVRAEICWNAQEIREQTVGQFKKVYSLILLWLALYALACRGLVNRLDNGRWVITELGEEVAYVIMTDQAYKEYTEISTSPNVLPFVPPRDNSWHDVLLCESVWSN